ncbi:MAG: hypothetical protein RJA07_1624 [Bacteroidota bacterium]|jgi:hypothetical protein
MENLFQKSTLDNVMQRLQKINATTQRQWGTMTAAQMLAHTSSPLEFAMGDKTGKQSFIGKIFAPFAKKAFFDDKPYKQNLPTAPEFKTIDEKDFNTEKQRLINLLNRFNADGNKVAGKNAHLFLGTITADEWARTMYKHIDHHFRQFGV